MTILLWSAGAARSNLLNLSRQNSATGDQSYELKYFPSGAALNLFAFGFKNALADYLWFETVNYFGKHYRSDKNFTWLNHMCSVVTDLDPEHMDIYEFCALLLAWENKQPEAAVLIMQKAINVRPDLWRNYYLRAMTIVIFSLDPEEAKNDLIRASQLPDCPLFLKNLASRKISALQTPEETIAFLREMLANARDAAQREALKDRLLKAIHEKNILDLEKLVQQYAELYGQKPTELKSLFPAGSQDILKDPFGGHYYITAEGDIKSTSNQEILYLFKERKKDEPGDQNH